MGTPGGAVMSRLQRGRTRVRESLFALAAERLVFRQTHVGNAEVQAPVQHTYYPRNPADSQPS